MFGVRLRKEGVESYAKNITNCFFHHRHFSRSLRTHRTRFPAEFSNVLFPRLIHVNFRYTRIPEREKGLWMLPHRGVFIFNVCVYSKLFMDVVTI